VLPRRRCRLRLLGRELWQACDALRLVEQHADQQCERVGPEQRIRAPVLGKLQVRHRHSLELCGYHRVQGVHTNNPEFVAAEMPVREPLHTHHPHERQPANSDS
jgi:hypothetical protein